MFKLDPLLYHYDELQPYIDAKTMEIHYTKHHQTYITNLNTALQMYPELQNKSVYDLLIDTNSLPVDIKNTVINNGGGHYNHTLFWLMMCPEGKILGNGTLFTAIQGRFGSFDHFKILFENAAKARFGSGWAWLTVDRVTGVLDVVSTANQDCPISNNKEVLLGLDVWEHAYYLHYQNRRADYITAWWNVVNWGYVQDRYAEILQNL